jgi:hypothetical protein
MDGGNRRQFLKQAAGSAAAVTGAWQAVAAPEAARGRVLARVAMHKGVPTLFIDDAPRVPYVYFFPVPVKEHIADFTRGGISIYSWGWGSQIPHCLDMGWKGPGQFDYTDFDAQVSTILDANPHGYLIPRLAVSAPERWLEAHPDDRFVTEEGRYPNAGEFCRYVTSMASKGWLRDASAALERFIRHVRGMPYAARVIGYQITGGFNEWFYCPDEFPDFSPAFRRSFGEWLGTRYHNDVAALRDSWRMPQAAFEDPPLPRKEARLKTDVNLLRDPALSRWVSDYYQFLSEADAAALVHLAGVGKAACNRESLIGAFYGYVMNAAGGYSNLTAPVNWGHQALLQVLESPDVDYLCAPYQYTHRGPGGYDGPQSVEESVRLHGKLFLTECDTATFVPAPANWNTQGRGVPSRAVSFGILKRDFSHRLIARDGMWWMDLVPKGGWYHHPDIVRFFKRTCSLFDKSARLDMRYQGEVAVIIDTDTPYYLKPGVELLFPLVFLQDRLGLPRMGTTYDLYVHDDLARPDMPEYKLYIFLNTLYLTSAERRAIQHHVQRDNKVAVWMYAPGVLSEGGLSVNGIRELSGMRIQYKAVSAAHHFLSSRVYITDFDHPITSNLDSIPFFGTDSPIGPVFYCDDPEARVLGRLLPDHATEDFGEWPGFAVREFSDWKSIFISVPNVPSAFLRNIAYYAGCHVYSDSHDILYANSHFVCLHANKGGEKRFRLRNRSDVYDAFTEQRIAAAATEFTDTVPQYGTKLYFLGDVRQIADAETRFEL